MWVRLSRRRPGRGWRRAGGPVGRAIRRGPVWAARARVGISSMRARNPRALRQPRQASWPSNSRKAGARRPQGQGKSSTRRRWVSENGKGRRRRRWRRGGQGKRRSRFWRRGGSRQRRACVRRREKGNHQSRCPHGGKLAFGRAKRNCVFELSFYVNLNFLIQDRLGPRPSVSRRPCRRVDRDLPIRHSVPHNPPSG